RSRARDVRHRSAMENAAIRLQLPVTERTGTYVRSGRANESGGSRNSGASRTSRQALECQCRPDGDDPGGKGSHGQSRVFGGAPIQISSVILRSAPSAPRDRTSDRASNNVENSNSLSTASAFPSPASNVLTIVGSITAASPLLRMTNYGFLCVPPCPLWLNL